MVGYGRRTGDDAVCKGSGIVDADGIDGWSSVVNGFDCTFRGISPIGIGRRGGTGNDIGRIDGVVG